MTSLYRYMAISYIETSIKYGIWASRLSEVNDPYEGFGIRYGKQYRVACLTSSPFQMLMWAYYGHHRGCCVEFDVSSIGELIKPVAYVDIFKPHDDMSQQEIVESLYKKGREWKHENEHRLVYDASSYDANLWNVTEDDGVYLKAPVKSITFGFAAEMDSGYIAALEYIRTWNSEHPKNQIAVSKCTLMSDRYQLKKIKEFQIESELKMFR